MNSEHNLPNQRQDDSPNTREKKLQISSVLKSAIKTERRGRKESSTEPQRLLENTLVLSVAPCWLPIHWEVGEVWVAEAAAGCSDKHKKK